MDRGNFREGVHVENGGPPMHVGVDSQAGHKEFQYKQHRPTTFATLVKKFRKYLKTR